ncbi:hypothetical protein MAR_008051 [Mya arenaria]|uniref:Mutator-like transposase domain-containing protein n=1 Tax=Mya arenaria TaxID=6604 RepID=A0ABY7DXY6_MYAAR|nr:hypothetical protein MAR_008051 [Mya arenaria]
MKLCFLVLKIQGKWWYNVFQNEMKKVGNEEREKAIMRNDMHEGVHALTVVCDGGWSKRTQKHTYNALGGVDVIFGADSKKLLHIGIRNKQCIICSAAANNNVDSKNMIVTETGEAHPRVWKGFLQAEKVYGVRYIRIIADCDSSV